MYTIESADGSRDLTLEHGLQKLETRFSEIRDNLLRRKPLTSQDRFDLCVFVATMHARTPVRRQHNAAIWNEVLRQGKQISQRVKNLTAQERANFVAEPRRLHRGLTIPPEKIEQWTKEPLQSWLGPEATNLAPVLFQMDSVLYETSDATGFITSDNPCAWFDPEAYKRSPFYQAPGLMYETIEITFPVCPQFMLLFNWRGLNGHFDAGARDLDQFNGRTRFFADKYFVVNSKTKKEIWFDPGIEPEDSWRKTHAEEPDFDVCE